VFEWGSVGRYNLACSCPLCSVWSSELPVSGAWTFRNFTQKQRVCCWARKWVTVLGHVTFTSLRCCAAQDGCCVSKCFTVRFAKCFCFFFSNFIVLSWTSDFRLQTCSHLHSAVSASLEARSKARDGCENSWFTTVCVLQLQNAILLQTFKLGYLPAARHAGILLSWCLGLKQGVSFGLQQVSWKLKQAKTWSITGSTDLFSTQVGVLCVWPLPRLSVAP